MSDHFDKAMQDIAIKSAQNGGPTIQDVLTAMQASHLDATEGRDELANNVKSTTTLLHQEVLDAAKQRTKDIDLAARTVRSELLAYQDGQADRCASLHKELLDQEFKEAGLFRDVRRRDDPPEVSFFESRQSAFSDKDDTFFEMLLGYKMLRRIAIVVAMAFIVWGVAFWADSCSRQAYWGQEPPAIVASPQASETP